MKTQNTQEKQKLKKKSDLKVNREPILIAQERTHVPPEGTEHDCSDLYGLLDRPMSV